MLDCMFYLPERIMFSCRRSAIGGRGLESSQYENKLPATIEYVMSYRK